MIILECPHCQSCFTAEDWNKSPHLGDSIPETIDSLEEYEDWKRKEGGGRFDCPDCKEVAITDDMTVV